MMNFLESLNIKVFYYDPYLNEKFVAEKVDNLEELTLKSDIIFLSYIDQSFNPIIQVKNKKKIWDLWYHFSDSKFNKIFHKESDFKKFTPNNVDTSTKIVKLIKNFR